MINRIDSIESCIPGAGCINLNGTSVTNSPPSVPQLTLTRIEYEITMPIASVEVFPSVIKVDDAKLTSSSFKCPSKAMPVIKWMLSSINRLENENFKQS